MRSEFEMSIMGELSFFLGLQIKQTPGGTFISQEKYIRGLLKKYQLMDVTPIDTSMGISAKLDADEASNLVNATMYRGIFGSLLYLTASRPDIVFTVGMCARFQSCPKESHLKAAKRILRYLEGSECLALYYPAGGCFDLIAYADIDFIGYLVDKKSTSGMAHFLGPLLIS